MIDRRTLLLSAAAAAATSAAVLPPIPAVAGTASPNRPGSRLDKIVRLLDPMVDLKNTNTGERLTVRFHSPTGYSTQAIKQINWFMRDWRQRETSQFDIRVVWGLAALRQAGIKDGNAGVIHVNSGYRTRKTNDLLRRQGYGAARNSYHLKAQAVDFFMPGADVKDLANYAAWLQIGGTGHYSGRFVHVDSGEQRTWVG